MEPPPLALVQGDEVLRIQRLQRHALAMELGVIAYSTHEIVDQPVGDVLWILRPRATLAHRGQGHDRKLPAQHRRQDELAKHPNVHVLLPTGAAAPEMSSAPVERG